MRALASRRKSAGKSKGKQLDEALLEELRAEDANRPGPRLDEEQKALLLLLLASGQHGTAIGRFFAAAGWDALSSSTLSYYRKLYAKQIAAAAAARVDEAMVSGLALKAERVAALKEHAEQLGLIKFIPDRHGRLWNERAWRLTLEDIAQEMGDRKPKDAQSEQIIKVYVGLDPDKV